MQLALAQRQPHLQPPPPLDWCIVNTEDWSVIKIRRVVSFPFRGTVDQCDSAVKGISYTVIIGVR